MKLMTGAKARGSWRTTILSLAVLGAGASMANDARADARICASAHATGQRESRAGRLRSASQLFTQCGSDESCPEEMRRECTEYLQAVRARAPTIIVAVQDEGQRDVSEARIFADTELIAEVLDGRAIEVDPGKQRLKVVLPSGEELASEVVIREGEKNRMIPMKTAKAVAAERAVVEARAEPPASPASPDTVEPSRPGPPAAAWIFGGLAVAAAGTGAALAVMGHGKSAELDACRPNCSAERRGAYDDMKSLYLGADIAFGVGIASAVTAAVFFLLPRRAEKTASGARPNVTLSAAPATRGGAFVLGGHF